MRPANTPLIIQAGATFRARLRAMAPSLVYLDITQISNSAPVRLTVDHGLPADWPVWVENVQHFPGLNRAPIMQTPHMAQVVDEATLEINSINGSGHQGRGGQLVYHPPLALVEAGATLTLWDQGQAVGVLPVAVDPAGWVDIELSPEETAALTWRERRYTLDVSFAAGEVLRLFHGQVQVIAAGVVPSGVSAGYVVVGGDRGPRGLRGPAVAAAAVDDSGQLVFIMDDGEQVNAGPLSLSWGTLRGDITEQADLQARLASISAAVGAAEQRPPLEPPPFQLMASAGRWAVHRARDESLVGPIGFATQANAQPARLTFQTPYSGDGPLLLCMYFGGIDDAALAPREEYAPVLRQGVIWARCRFSGNSYGSPAAMQDARDVYERACQLAPVGGVVLVGHSMGALAALNAATTGAVPGVLGVYLTDPVVSLAERFAGGRRELIRQAYGIAADGSDYATRTAGHDPALQPWPAFRGVPIHCIASTGDTMVPYEMHAELLRDKLQAHNDITLVTRTSAGHGAPDRFSAELLSEFLRKVARGAIIEAPPEPAPIITSDSFARTGALFGSATDVYAGGEPRTWGGTAGNNITTESGRLTIGSTAVFSQCVDTGTADVDLRFVLIQGPAAAIGVHSIVDLRKATAATGDCLRLVLHSHVDGVTVGQLYRRVGGSATALGSTFLVPDGALVRLVAKGADFRCDVDGGTVSQVVEEGVMVGTFCGFAGSSGNRPWVVSELSVRAS